MQQQVSSPTAMDGKETDWQQDRKACLQCLAAFYRDPSQFGFSSTTELIIPYGFNLQTAEFEPDALKCFRDPAKARAAREQKLQQSRAAQAASGSGSSCSAAQRRNPFAQVANQGPFQAQSSPISPFSGTSTSPFGPSMRSPFQQ